MTTTTAIHRSIKSNIPPWQHIAALAGCFLTHRQAVHKWRISRKKKNNNNNKKNFKATVVNALLPARSIPSVNHTSCVESCFPINQSKKIKLIDSPNLEPRVILAPCQRYSHQIIGKYLIYLGIYVPNKYYVLYLAYVLYFTKEIKNMPNTLLSYLSTRELLRTREKCGEAWAEGGCFSHNARRTSFFISFIKCVVNCARSYRWRRLCVLYLNWALVWRRVRAYGNKINSFWPITARAFFWTFYI